MLYTATYLSPLGRMLLAATEEALVGAWFEGQRFFGLPPQMCCREKETPILCSAIEWLERYFRGEAPPLDLPLHMEGTPFQLSVWGILCKIPYGCTLTYGEIARQLALAAGQPTRSAQAVGQAVGQNKLSVFVPCHRVLGAKGKLTGYAGGLDRKRALLSLEGVQAFE